MLENQSTDLDLIRAVQMRDADALKGLYDRYGRTAFGLAYRVVQDAATAEEIVQDLFTTAWNRADQFNASRSSNVRGWLLTIAYRRAIDYRRKGTHDQSSASSIDDRHDVLETPDAWSDVSRTLDQERIREALDALPVEQRRTIELSFFDGLSHGEIAEREQESLGTVKGRIRLGLGKLNSMLRVDQETGGFSQ